ncbi:MAG: ribonuclease PH [Christensenellales bacterium]|jgi:ribonuclease PH
MRIDKREAGELRPITIETDFIESAHGSVLVSCGKTRLICTAMLEDRVAPFLSGSGQGWLTAEYAMLPASTPSRKMREGRKGVGVDGRAMEIQRMIGRSLRAGMDLKALGERTLTIDCDVIQADGGTRTAAITGGFVAAALAVDRLLTSELIVTSPVRHMVAAVSAGVVGGEILLDLCYEEDARADSDINVVFNELGQLLEVQGTAERAPFETSQLQTVLSMTDAAVQIIIEKQKEALGEAWDRILKKD